MNTTIPKTPTEVRSERSKAALAKSERMKAGAARRAEDRTKAAEMRRRQVSRRFDPPTPEAILGCAGFYDAWVSHLSQGTELPIGTLLLLVGRCSHGPVFDAHSVPPPVPTWSGSYAISFQMVGREEQGRYIDPFGFLVLRVLTLFVDEMPALSGKTVAGRPEHLPILAEGFTLGRLLVNADADEDVRLHPSSGRLDLGPWALERVPGRPWANRERHHAIERALKFYTKNARRWSLESTITARQYEDLIKGVFRLYDAVNAKHLMRPIGLVGEAAED